MSTLLLSLLLLILIAIGLLMGKKVAEGFTSSSGGGYTASLLALLRGERFENPEPPAAPAISPALANLLATPALVAATQKPVPSVDKLARDKDAAAAAEAVAQPPPPPPGPGPAPAPTPDCPKCPVCPDMSQYIRMDEVPCWNCTLP